MGYWNGRAGGVVWHYFHGAVTATEWARYIEAMRTLGAPRFEEWLLLTCPHESTPPNASQRAQLKELAGTPWAAHAFVTSSRMLRGINTMINWVVQKPFPEKTFATFSEAYAWFATLSPRFDAAALRLEMASTIPPTARWKFD